MPARVIAIVIPVGRCHLRTASSLSWLIIWPAPGRGTTGADRDGRARPRVTSAVERLVGRRDHLVPGVPGVLGLGLRLVRGECVQQGGGVGLRQSGRLVEDGA